MNLTIESYGKKANNPYSTLLFLTICGAVVGGTYIRLLSYMALLVSIVAVVVLSEEDSVCFMMFLMPFAGIFKASPGSQSFFTYLLLFYVLWCMFKKHRINTSFLMYFLFLLVFLVAQMLISVNILRTIKFVVNILFVYLAVSKNANKDNKRIYLWYILGMILSSAVAEFIPNLNQFKTLSQYYDNLARFSGLYGDPNYYSINIIISLCLTVILYHKKQLGTVWALLLAAILVTFAIMTYSKSAFLMLLLPLLLLLYSQVRKRKYFVFALSFLAVVILVSRILARQIDAFDAVLSRLFGDDGGSFLTGRDELWANYIEYFRKSWRTVMVGNGFNAALINEYAAHNTYIDLIYYLGLVGTALLAGVFYAIVKPMPNPEKKNFLNYSIWLCLMAMYSFLSELFYYDWAFHIIIAALISKTDINIVPRGEKNEKI